MRIRRAGVRVVAVDEADWERRALTVVGAECTALLVLVEGAEGTGKTELLRRLIHHVGQSPESEHRRIPVLWPCGSRSRPSALPDGRPALLMVDDVHLADAGEREWLRALLHRPPPGFAAVLAYRPEDLAWPGLPLGIPRTRYSREMTVLRRRISPWNLEQVREAAEEVLREHCTPPAVARLHQLSGGVAQVVVDLLAELADGVRQPVTVEDVDAIGTPVRLAEQTLSRLASLPEVDQPVVRGAAVLDMPATREELLTVAGMPSDRGVRALASATSGAMLSSDAEGRYYLPVPAAAHSLRETLPWPLRQDHHRRAARVLARRGEAPWAEVARHRKAGGDVRGWLRAVEKAARRYAEARAYQPTVTLLQGVLASPDTDPATRARLAPMLARGAIQGLGVEQTTRVLSRIVEDDALRNAVRGEIRMTLGLLCNHAGDWGRARRELEQAAAELREIRPDLAARAMSALAIPDWPETSIAAHLSWLHLAEEAAEASDSELARTNVAATRATVEVVKGNPRGWELAEGLPADAADPQLRLEAARGLCNAAESMSQLGHHQRADAMLTRGAEIVVNSGAPYARQAMGAIRLLRDWRTGEWTGLARRCEEYVAEASASGQTSGGGRLILGLLALARGAWLQADSWLSGAEDDFSGRLRSAAHGGLIRLALARDDVPAAAETARMAWRCAEGKGAWSWTSDMAPWAVEAIARAGDTATARDMIAAIAAGLDGSDAPAASASLLWARAALAEVSGRSENAVLLYRQASEVYAALPNPYARALTTEGAARCALSRTVPFADENARPQSSEDSEKRRGISELLDAGKVYTELGAIWDAARVRTLLRIHDGEEKRPRGRPSCDGRLSPRELEVAELAVSGLTNREIAHTLHLSSRTVEQHVARAMRKTGTDSRRGLAEVTTGLLVAD